MLTGDHAMPPSLVFMPCCRAWCCAWPVAWYFKWQLGLPWHQLTQFMYRPNDAWYDWKTQSENTFKDHKQICYYLICLHMRKHNNANVSQAQSNVILTKLVSFSLQLTYVPFGMRSLNFHFFCLSKLCMVRRSKFTYIFCSDFFQKTFCWGFKLGHYKRWVQINFVHWTPDGLGLITSLLECEQCIWTVFKIKPLLPVE